MKNNNRIVIGLSALLATLPITQAEDIFTPGDPIIAIDAIGTFSSDYLTAPTPVAGESAINVSDSNSATKYLNFGKEQSGIIVTPAIGSTVIQSLTLVTANDAVARDPASLKIGLRLPVARPIFPLIGLRQDLLSKSPTRLLTPLTVLSLIP